MGTGNEPRQGQVHHAETAGMENAATDAPCPIPMGGTGPAQHYARICVDVYLEQPETYATTTG